MNQTLNSNLSNNSNQQSQTFDSLPPMHPNTVGHQTAHVIKPPNDKGQLLVTQTVSVRGELSGPGGGDIHHRGGLLKKLGVKLVSEKTKIDPGPCLFIGPDGRVIATETTTSTVSGEDRDAVQNGLRVALPSSFSSNFMSPGDVGPPPLHNNNHAPNLAGNQAHPSGNSGPPQQQV